jgi:hypothetical protein
MALTRVESGRSVEHSANLARVVAVKIDEAKARHEPRLMALPNVVGVGMGEKGGQPVIKVFVTTKVPAGQLNAGEIVPEELEGFATDVEAIGVVTAEGND